MKVKDRLAAQFTFMFAILLFVVLIGVYYLVGQNRQESFYTKLDDRALTMGELYLAQDNMSQESFKKVVEKYPQVLSHEVIRIYNAGFQPVFIKEDSVSWPKEVINTVIEKKEIHFTQGNKQVAGLYYEDNSGNFVVIASAIDDTGYQNMKRLGWIMLFSFLSSLIITFFLGRLFATIALKPISKIINDVKIIRATSLNQRLSITQYKNDEINQLSITINNLLEHLEQSFEAQRSFITYASHELRTPLTSILGNAEITLKNDREKEDYKNVLHGIVKESEKLNQLINSLLELAQANMDDDEMEKIQLDEVLWEVVDEWGDKPNQVKLEYKLPADKSRFTINGNRRLLFIAISNILKNAIKFSNDKEVYCELGCTENETVITIKDSGIGIATDEIKNIFTPFYRAPNAGGHKGTGIGLSLADKIIRLHNGTIEVRSELYKETTFLIHLPL
jgi:signal transduction histidine kinase